VNKYDPQPKIESTTDSDATVKATEKGMETMTFDVDQAEITEDGTVTSESYEHPRSSRVQYLERLEQLDRERRDTLESLEPLTEESRVQQAEMLEAMDAEAEQAEDAEPQPEPEQITTPTPEEVAAIERIAQNDAIALARARALASDPTGLAVQYAQAQQQVIANYEQKLVQVKAQHADFDETFAALAQNGDVALSHAKIEALVTVGGPELVYKLAKSPDKAHELAALPDHVAVAKIGQMAAELNRPKPQPVARTKNAIVPMRPVGGGNIRTAPELNDPNISYADFKRAREKQLKHRYGR
jgi:hypothetical protein